MATLAIVFGGALSFLVLLEFGHSYTNAVGFPKPFLGISSSHFYLAIAGTVAGLLLAAAWPLSRIVRLSPQDAVRADRGNGGQSLGKIVASLSKIIRGRIWLTYPLRNIMRSKFISLMTILSITLAMGVSLSYFIATTSFKDSIVEKFDNDNWQIAVDFLTPVWEDELSGLFEGIREIKAVDPYIRGGIRVEYNGTRMSSLLGSINPKTAMHHIPILSGHQLKEGDTDAILLERKLARSLGVKIGDTINVESQGQIYQATVKATFSGAFPGESYTDLSTARKWMKLDTQLNGVFLEVGENPRNLVKSLEGVKHVGQVTLKSELAKEVVAVSEEALAIIYVSASFSIAVTLLFLFTSATFTVLQRKNEYILLRVIGFKESTLSLMIYVEVVFLGLIAAALAIPTGYLIAASLVEKLSEAWFTVTASMSIFDVAIIIGPAIVLLPVSAWPVARMMRKLSPVKTLKERMFG